MKKKIYVLTFIIMLLISLMFAGNAYATDTEEMGKNTYTVDPREMIQNQKNVVENKEEIEETLKTMPSGPVFYATPNVSTDLETIIVNGIKNRETEIDISSYNLYTDTFNYYVFSYLLNDHPELFYCGGINTNYLLATNQIISLSPVYIYDEETTASIQSSLDYYLNEVLKGVDSDMTDLEKIMVAHDFIIKDCDYDYDRLNTDTLVYEDFNLVGVLDGLAVCQGYTQMLKYLLDQMNVESTYVYSVNMNHIWNAVKIDGKYYHLDATWTDPGDYSIANVNRTYFLKGNDYFLNSAGHYDWETAIAATEFGTAYDSYFWNDYDRFLVYTNDYWYYMNSDYTLQKINLRNNASKTTITVPNLSSYATELYLGSNGTELYCMDNASVYKINLTDLSIVKYWTPEFETEDIYLGAITSLSPDIIEYRYEDDTTYAIDYFIDIPMEAIEFDVETLDMNVGDTTYVSATILPEDTTEEIVYMSISSSDESVVTVDDTGLVTAIGPGTATITGIINNCSDTITVTVVDPNAGSDGDEGTTETGLLGDVDLNGRITVTDARYVVTYVLGERELTEEQLANADVDSNGRIMVADARKIIEIVLGN